MGPRPGRKALRQVLALAAGVAVAGLGALVLGEYPFSGVVVLGAGILLGLFVGEAFVAVGGVRGRVPAVTCAVLAAAALVWAAWIAENHDLARVAPEGWVAVGLGAAAGAIRARTPRAAADSSPAPAPEP